MQSSKAEVVALLRARGASFVRVRSLIKSALAALAMISCASACSTQQCQSMKASGSIFAVFCGGEGDTAPEPADGGPNACSDIKQVMPAFFQLLEDNQLTGIQEAVEQIGQPVCADEGGQRPCNADTTCPIGACDFSESDGGTTGLCPCQNSYSPLGDLLELAFSGIATIASPTEAAEPGAVAPSKCVDATTAEMLTPAQRNPLCEIRRTIDFLVEQDGGAQLFNDPQIISVVVSLLNYIQGTYPATASDPTPTPHYDLFTTFGLMAQNPGVCDPQTTYDLLDKALGYLTPAVGNKLVGDVNALLNDPTTVGLLAELGGGGSDPVARRQAFVTILLGLLPSIQAAPSAAGPNGALTPIENLLVNLLHLYAADSTYSQQFQNEVRAVFVDLGCADPENTGVCSVPNDPVMGSGLLGPDAGIFPDITNPTDQTGLLWCIAYVDPQGNLLGAVYDLITLQSTAAGGAINIGTLLGAVQKLLALDPTGQTERTLRFVIESISGNADATEALRQLLAKTLTPAIGQELIPPLSQLVQKQVIGEILDLLQDLLYSCQPPPSDTSSASPPN